MGDKACPGEDMVLSEILVVSIIITENATGQFVEDPVWVFSMEV